MSDEIKVLAERLKGIEVRVASLEEGHESHGEKLTKILVEIAKLQTKVTIYAACVAAAVSVAVKFLL